MHKVLVCQNCKKIMREDDKYCTNCGTARNEAAFEPIENHMRLVYGPPIKEKYECHKCGHIWITMGIFSEHSFCPECGDSDIELILRKAWEYDGPVGILEPMSKEEMKGPFLTETEVFKILDARKCWDDIEGEDYEDKLVKIGFPEASKVWSDDLTEREGERITLELFIKSLYGDNPYAFSNEHCPQCNGKMLAALSYYDSSHECMPDIHNKADGSELIGSSRKAIRKDDAENYPAYRCLCCGKKFGELKLD